MKTTKLSATDVLVRRVTAFRDWADMLESLREGYVPTLRHSKAGMKLAVAVEAAGFRVYMPGSGMATRR